AFGAWNSRSRLLLRYGYCCFCAAGSRSATQRSVWQGSCSVTRLLLRGTSPIIWTIGDTLSLEGREVDSSHSFSFRLTRTFFWTKCPSSSGRTPYFGIIQISQHRATCSVPSLFWRCWLRSGLSRDPPQKS